MAVIKDWLRAGHRGLTVVLLAGTLAVPLTAPTPVQAAAPLTVDTFADLAEMAGPAVVNIDTVARRQVQVMPHPFGAPELRSFEQRGLGSGFIVDSSGLIVTNNHVIQGATQVIVTLSDGRKFPAKLVGRDPLLDLAVLKVEATGLPVLRFATDSSVRVGDWVMALGSPLGLDKTVTKGIVSALHRRVAINESVQFIQTDAPINPGSSGGPLINMSGQVIGVNTAVAAQAQGIGFAIPAGVTKQALDQLRAHGTVRRPWLGVGIQEVTPERARQAGLQPGLMVIEVYKGTGAARAGLTDGDILVSVDGVAVPNIAALRAVIQRKRPGDKVTVTLLRDGKRRQVSMTLSDMPDEQPTR
ncbi:MAG: trypsin-like peptidase domain-containing protein [Candidatus Sericytochromatia bacterium]|nr:trypsin-like peptidase domain-containing protein [Candidatus Sericytochromatia bacterium]